MRGPLELIYGIYPNNGLKKCIIESRDLFLKAKSDIKIVTGMINHQLYNDPIILESFKKVIEKNVNIEIISGPDLDKKSTGIIELCKEGKITIWKLDFVPEFHFFVVDGKHIRIEDFHGKKEHEVAYLERRTIAAAAKRIREYNNLKEQAIKFCIGNVA